MFARNKKLRGRYRSENGVVCLDIKVATADHLFDQRDPAPFRERDLEDDAVKYIVGAVREIGLRAPMKLVLNIESQKGDLGTATIKRGIQSFFEHELELSRQQLIQHFKHCQISFVIGLSFLFLFIYLSHQIGSVNEGSMAYEGLNILGWVTMWKPIELLLYSWWPIWQDKRTYEKLSQIKTEVRYGVGQLRKVQGE